MAVNTSELLTSIVTLKIISYLKCYSDRFSSFQIGSAIKQLKRETFCILLEDLIFTSASIPISFWAVSLNTMLSWASYGRYVFTWCLEEKLNQILFSKGILLSFLKAKMFQQQLEMPTATLLLYKLGNWTWLHIGSSTGTFIEPEQSKMEGANEGHLVQIQLKAQTASMMHWVS